MRKRARFWAFISLAAVAVVGCGKSGSGNSASTTQPTASAGGQSIAVIAKATTASYWKSVEAGARTAAADDHVEIIWMGPDSETSHAQQAAMVDNMVNRGVSGIVLAPTNVDALVRPVDAATQRGTPVVLMDSNLNSKTPSSVVATDNEAAGRQGGEALVKAIGDKKTNGGKVLLLRYLEGAGSTEARAKGFTDAITKAGLTIAGEAYIKGQGTTTDAADTADALLRRFLKDNVVQVDGIFAVNQPGAIGMLRKIEQFRAGGITVNCPFVGFDSHETLLAGVRAGEVAAIITQDPRRIGYEAVKTLDKVIKGEKVDPFIATPTATITKENIDSPEIKQIVGE